jgi:hypothetical protein
LRGQFIGNPSQRIAELEALGHPISHTRERLHGQATGTRYRLVSGAASAVSLGGTHGHAPAGVAPESTLFDPAEGSRTLSPYDKEAA